MRPELGSHPFFTHFPAASGARLEKHVRIVRFPHRAEIFAEGSASDCVYLVLTGRVILAKKSAANAAQLIAHKDPNDYFGELGVLDGSVRSTSAVADGPVQLGRLPAKPFLQAVSQSSWHTLLRLFSQVSENLRATNNRYVSEVVRKEKLTLVGEMANSMVHDFRGPFSTIKLATELLSKRAPTDENRELCAMILRQVDRLSGMVEEVLDFARGETRLKVRTALLQDVFTQLIENNLEVLARAGVRLRVYPTRIALPLDTDRIQRVLQNLITNAKEALGAREDATVTVRARREGQFGVLTVADNGPGISRDIRASVFEPFVTHGKTGGTGLGLAISKSIVAAHHGTIDFTTSRRGTTFVIKLPLN